jgi:hypothetical protein
MNKKKVVPLQGILENTGKLQKTNKQLYTLTRLRIEEQE